MKLRMYSIYDSKAEAYVQPFYAPTNAVALRSFARAAQDSEGEIGRFAEDYTLFAIGEFDPVTGIVSCFEAKEPLGCALEYKQASGLRAVGE